MTNNSIAQALKLALEYLRSEPMKEYEERKAAKALKEKEDLAKKAAASAASPASALVAADKTVNGGKPAPVAPAPEAAKVVTPASVSAEPQQTAEAETSASDGEEKAEMPKPVEGMMAGMYGGRNQKKADAKPMSNITIFGRYAKILMSSPEFTFIN